MLFEMIQMSEKDYQSGCMMYRTHSFPSLRDLLLIFHPYKALKILSILKFITRQIMQPGIQENVKTYNEEEIRTFNAQNNTDPIQL